MKRSLYRRLHRTLHPFLGHARAKRVATAVLTVPDPTVPRWLPGPGWTELATARYWARPAPGGDLVMVRTWGHDENGYTDDEVLATGLLTDFHGSVADKHHRIHSLAEPGTVRTELVHGEHPAERYRLYHEAVTERFEYVVEQAQDAVDYPPRYRSLGVRPDVELRPDGWSWACSLHLDLSPDPAEYWWDLARAVDVLSRVARTCRVPRIALYRDNPYPVTDPLWHHGWAELETRRAGLP
jgi:hypothetical protein